MVVVGLRLGEFVDLVFRIVERNGCGVVSGIKRWFDELFDCLFGRRKYVGF